jgi:mono/diheme cytochrome c family protein
MWRRALLVLALTAAAAPVGASEVYDGYVSAATGGATATATLDVHRKVRGSVSLDLLPPLGAEYLVRGRMRGRRIALTGRAAGGRRLVWRGRRQADGSLRGVLRLRVGYARLRGNLRLVLRAAGDSCDPYFRDTVMPSVLVPVCGKCHVAGGSAAGTRLRIHASDARLTRASVAAVVDTADPPASLLLRKPLGELGHGGGVQLQPAGAEMAVLREWVRLVTAGVCTTPGGGGGGGPGGGGTGADLYAAHCASCHGADARGLDGRPSVRCHPAIAGPVRFGRSGPSGVMPPFPQLSDADVAAIQGHLDALCAAGGASGADLYAAACATCHGAGATGTAAAPSIRCATRAIDAMTRGRGAAMPTFAAWPLARMTAVTSHLADLCAAAGWPSADVYAGNCGTCHGTTGRGGRNAEGVRGPDIRCVSAHDLDEKVRKGDDEMPAFPTLATPARLAGLAGVLAGFCPGD